MGIERRLVWKCGGSSRRRETSTTGRGREGVVESMEALYGGNVYFIRGKEGTMEEWHKSRGGRPMKKKRMIAIAWRLDIHESSIINL